MTIFLFVTLLLISLWKEGVFLFMLLFFAHFGMHPLESLGISTLIYLLLFTGERLYGFKRTKHQSRRKRNISKTNCNND